VLAIPEPRTPKVKIVVNNTIPKLEEREKAVRKKEKTQKTKPEI
jgi:hypothetical protein